MGNKPPCSNLPPATTDKKPIEQTSPAEQEAKVDTRHDARPALLAEVTRLSLSTGDTSSTIYTTITDASHYKISVDERCPRRRSVPPTSSVKALLKRFPINSELSSSASTAHVHGVPWRLAYLLTKLINFGAHAVVFTARVVIYLPVNQRPLEPSTPAKESDTLVSAERDPDTSMRHAQNTKIRTIIAGLQDDQQTDWNGPVAAQESMRRFLTNITVAVKIVRVGHIGPWTTSPERFLLDRVVLEAVLLNQFDHPNIPRLIESFTVAPSCCVLVQQFLVGSVRRLYQEFGPLPEWLIAHILVDIVSVLDYLHSKFSDSTGVICVHRDIKASNILVSHNGRAMLVDFGVACMVAASRPFVQSVVGTPSWMAPEVMETGDTARPIGTPSDIWSLGMTIVEMATAQIPDAQGITDSESIPSFLQDGTYTVPVPTALEKRERTHVGDYETIYENVSSGLESNHKSTTTDLRSQPERFRINLIFSVELKEFVARCLQWDPVQRATARELLEHPFLTKGSLWRKRPSSYRDLFIQLHKEATERFDSARQREKPVLEQRTSVPGALTKLEILRQRIFEHGFRFQPKQYETSTPTTAQAAEAAEGDPPNTLQVDTPTVAVQSNSILCGDRNIFNVNYDTAQGSSTSNTPTARLTLEAPGSDLFLTDSFPTTLHYSPTSGVRSSSSAREFDKQWREGDHVRQLYNSMPCLEAHGTTSVGPQKYISSQQKHLSLKTSVCEPTDNCTCAVDASKKHPYWYGQLLPRRRISWPPIQTQGEKIRASTHLQKATNGLRRRDMKFGTVPSAYQRPTRVPRPILSRSRSLSVGVLRGTSKDDTTCRILNPYTLEENRLSRSRASFHIPSDIKSSSSEHTLSDGAFSRAAESLATGRSNVWREHLVLATGKQMVSVDSNLRTHGYEKRSHSGAVQPNLSVSWGLLESRVSSFDNSKRGIS